MLVRTSRPDSAQKSPRERYFEDGRSWETDVYRRFRSSRNRAWVITFIVLGLLALSLASLALLIPLKQLVPYVITVDRSTGYVDIPHRLDDGPLTQNEAITKYFLVRYVTARETYDPPDLEENYNTVLSFSDGEALDEYLAIWSNANPENPVKVYERRVEVDIDVKNISFLNEKTASVRFLRNETANKRTETTHWVAIIYFTYVNEPTREKDRFKNPLGFKVISYRVDQEILGEERP